MATEAGHPIASEPVVVFPHDPRWASLADEEMSRLSSCLGSLLVRADHVGSTAVADLPAKPVIDLQVSVSDHAALDACRAPLTALGYEHLPIAGFEEYPFYRRHDERGQAFHVHLCIAGSHNERRHLAVRDHLRRDAAARQAYGDLKLELVERRGGDRDAYIEGKDDFVRRLEQAALDAQGEPLMGDGDT